MKTFIGMETVQAKLMTLGEFNALNGFEMQENDNPEELGYFVQYHDVSTTWFPKAEFEALYKDVKIAISYSEALKLMKDGKRVARAGWNGKGMYIFQADKIDFFTRADLSEFSEHENGQLTVPSLVMRTADKKFVVGWLASQTDMLAEDWFVLD